MGDDGGGFWGKLAEKLDPDKHYDLIVLLALIVAAAYVLRGAIPSILQYFRDRRRDTLEHIRQTDAVKAKARRRREKGRRKGRRKGAGEDDS